jgi:hypothetical protein
MMLLVALSFLTIASHRLYLEAPIIGNGYSGSQFGVPGRHAACRRSRIRKNEANSSALAQLLGSAEPRLDKLIHGLEKTIGIPFKLMATSLALEPKA